MQRDDSTADTDANRHARNDTNTPALNRTSARDFPPLSGEVKRQPYPYRCHIEYDDVNESAYSTEPGNTGPVWRLHSASANADAASMTIGTAGKKP